MSINIFVYGTLRRGGYLNYKLQGIPFVGLFKTKPIYTLYSAGCPCLSLNGTMSVTGEIYEIESLHQINNIHQMELSAGYTFKPVELLNFNGEAFAYFQTPLLEWGRYIIPEGDWILHGQNKDRARR